MLLILEIQEMINGNISTDIFLFVLMQYSYILYIYMYVHVYMNYCFIFLIDSNIVVNAGSWRYSWYPGAPGVGKVAGHSQLPNPEVCFTPRYVSALLSIIRVSCN